MNVTTTALRRAALMLAMAIVALCLCPAPGFAQGTSGETTSEWNTSAQGTVYFSASSEARYVTADGSLSGMAMGYVPVKLSDIATWASSESYAQLGWDDYAVRAASGAGYDYELTVLQLFAYVAQRYSAGGASAIQLSGAPGHVYIQGGLFGGSYNLNYFANGAFPLKADGETGATCDEILLEDGMFVDLALFKNLSFWSDPVAGFHYFTSDGSTPTHAYTAEPGEPCPVQLVRIYGNMNNPGVGQKRTPEGGWTVYWGTADDWGAYTTATPTWQGTATTDAEGRASITFASEGTYYLWVDGGKGSTEDTATSAVSTPAFATVIVAKRTDIAQAQVSAAKQTWTGKQLTPAVKVILNGKALVQGSDYEVAYKSNKAVGTATVTVTGVNAYKGSAQGSFAIAKAPGKLAVTAKAASAKKALRAKKGKKTTFAASKYVKIGCKTGTVCYAKANKAGGKKIAVAKNGKLTVKKGLKKGTYTVKVKLTAKATATHTSAAKTITVKVAVK